MKTQAGPVGRRPHAAVWAAVATGVVALFALGVSRSTAPRVVQAEVFELIGPDGAVRARIGCAPDGPTMDLLDKKGASRLTFGLAADGHGEFIIRNADGTPAWAIQAAKDGPTMQMSDAKGRTRASIEVDSGTTYLHLLDPKNDAARLTLYADETGGRMSVRDKAGDSVVEIGEKTHGGRIEAMAATGSPKVSMGVGPDGGHLSVSDTVGERLRLGVWGDAAAVVLYDKRKNERMSLWCTDEEPAFSLKSDEKKEVFRLFARGKQAAMWFMDPLTGKPQLGLGVSKEKPRLVVYDEKGEHLAEIPAEAKKSP